VPRHLKKFIDFYKLKLPRYPQDTTICFDFSAMAPGRNPISARSALDYKIANKDKRKQFHIQQKKAKDVLRREVRFTRKKEESKNPKLKEARHARNKPQTIDSKRT
jgi:ribosome production factor 1